ncbi:ArsR/SmtB family transcription factor [Halosimplex salinum]|uniref:ArsR/SmtB family transcription factor n=1 Tax=Halosimplex salinum TaxID=1710538 RepID=UPI0013DDA5FF|nr:helix-turn-helix transcriptional regulator [Halosimplex salinum]
MVTGDTEEVSHLFQVLSHPHRRVVVYYLREHETASFATLAETVTGWIEAGPGRGESMTDRNVRATLHHAHLPALAEAGLVRYDTDSGTVTFLGLSAAADEVVDASLDADTSAARLDLERVLAAVDESGCGQSTDSTTSESDGSVNRGSGTDSGGPGDGN